MDAIRDLPPSHRSTGEDSVWFLAVATTVAIAAYTWVDIFHPDVVLGFNATVGNGTNVDAGWLGVDHAAIGASPSCSDDAIRRSAAE